MGNFFSEESEEELQMSETKTEKKRRRGKSRTLKRKPEVDYEEDNYNPFSNISFVNDEVEEDSENIHSNEEELPPKPLYSKKKRKYQSRKNQNR